MKNDNRIALPCNQGFQLTIVDECPPRNSYDVVVEQELGRGGSCIVYRGRLLNEAIKDKAIIIKEFYPKKIADQIDRKANMQINLQSDELKSSFEKMLSIFRNGQAQHIVFANDNPGCVLPSVFHIGKALGTLYAVSSITEGEVLSAANIEKYSIAEALRLAASICDAIQPLHNQYKVYQDIKPSNLFVNEFLSDNSDGQQIIPKVFLFDFDTVRPIDDVKYCSYSEGWCAPEQIPDKNGIINQRKIGIHTDVYSIGVILFWMLTCNGPCKAPAKKDLEAVQEGVDWKGQILRKDPKDALSNNTFIEKLDRLLKTMLIDSSEERRIHYSNIKSLVSVKDELASLVEIAETASIRKGQEIIDAHIKESKMQTIEGINKTKDEIIDALKSTIVTTNKPQNDESLRFDIPFRNDWFTGRQVEIETIENNYANGAHIQIIYGMGGMGKSQIAKEYLYRNMNHYQVIHWICTSTTEGIISRYKLFLKHVDTLQNEVSNVELCHEYFEFLSKQNSWLIIFDGCDYYTDSEFKEFTQQCLPKDLTNGHVLITTRNKRPIGKAKRIEIRTLEENDAVDFLLERTGERDIEGARKLAKRVGYLPLALELVGAYICATPAFGFQKYIDYLNKNSKIIDQTVELTDYDHSLTEVIINTFELIKEDYDSTYYAIIIEIMRLFAFLSPNHLSLKLFTDSSDRYENFSVLFSISCYCQDEIQLNELAHILVKYSLLREEKDGYYSMHELQQEVIRNSISKRTSEYFDLSRALACISYNSSNSHSLENNLRFLEHMYYISKYRLEYNKKINPSKELIEDSEFALLQDKVMLSLYLEEYVRRTSASDMEITEVWGSIIDSANELAWFFFNSDRRDRSVYFLSEFLIVFYNTMSRCIDEYKQYSIASKLVLAPLLAIHSACEELGIEGILALDIYRYRKCIDYNSFDEKPRVSYAGARHIIPFIRYAVIIALKWLVCGFFQDVITECCHTIINLLNQYISFFTENKRLINYKQVIESYIYNDPQRIPESYKDLAELFSQEYENNPPKIQDEIIKLKSEINHLTALNSDRN